MARFLLSNAVDSATLTTNQLIFDGLPLENVKKLSKSLVMRTQTNAQLTINGLFAGRQQISSFIIAGHNFIPTVTYQLILYSVPTDDPNYIVYNSGVLNVTEEQYGVGERINYISLWFEEYTTLFFKLIINKNGTSIPYFQIYRLFAGNYVETDINIDLDNSIFWNEDTNQYRTDFGTLRSDISYPYKTIDFNFSTMLESERERIQLELAKVGMRKEFYLDIFPTSTTQKGVDYRGIFKLKKVPKFSEYAQNIYRSDYTVEEV